MLIKEYRKAIGLTQEEFSKIFEIPIDTVKSWDCGRRKPTKSQEKLIIKELERIEKARESKGI